MSKALARNVSFLAPVSLLLVVFAPSSASADPALVGPTTRAPETFFKERDHEKLGKLIGEYFDAKRSSSGITESFQEVTEAVEKLEKKTKGTPLLALVEDWEASLYFAREYKSSVPKGRVSEEEHGDGFTYAVHAPKKYKPSKGPYPLILCLPDEGASPTEHLDTNWADAAVRDGAVTQRKVVIDSAEAAIEAQIGRAGEELWQSAIKRAEVETRGQRSARPAPRPSPSTPAASLARELANLSFASLFPRRTDAALSLEGDLATGALRSAVERADLLAEEVLRETARRAGLDAGTDLVSVVLLLGVDGATWLSFRRLVDRVREGGPVADRDALAAYALVIDLRLRADRIL